MQFTLQKRLMCGVAALLAVTGLVGFLGFRQLKAMDSAADDLGGNWVPSLTAIGGMQSESSDLRRAELLYYIVKDPQRKQGYADRIQKAGASLKESVASYERLVANAEERAIYDQLVPALKGYFEGAAEAKQLAADGKADDALQFASTTLREKYTAVTTGVEKLFALNSEGASNAAAKANRAYDSAVLQLNMGMVAGLAVGIAVGAVLVRSIRRPIAKVADALDAVASKDLTKPALAMTVEDEIGRLARATDSMQGSLRAVIERVGATSNDVAAASTEVAASSEELATTVRNQEQTTTQVASAVSELSSSVTEVATKAASASKSAEDSRKQADAGGELVGKTVNQLGEINNRFNDVAKVVTSLEQQGEEVGRIVQVIQDIADQTNLLALNAAIEAARAGEHGRGFAVVADEVRKLAERTTQATGEVSKTIGAMRDGTQKAASAMQVGRTTVEEGRTLGGKAGESVRGIVEGQKHAESMSMAIAAAAQQQASATEEIARSLEQMSAANAQSASAATQSSSAANSLSKQAEMLKQLVGQFKV